MDCLSNNDARSLLSHCTVAWAHGRGACSRHGFRHGASSERPSNFEPVRLGLQSQKQAWGHVEVAGGNRWCANNTMAGMHHGW